MHHITLFRINKPSRTICDASGDVSVDTVVLINLFGGGAIRVIRSKFILPISQGNSGR